MTAAGVVERAPAAYALPAPCWWVDRDDCWEITHHDTREDAEADHADRVRSDYGWVLSTSGAFEICPGRVRQEQLRCWKVTCPQCGAAQHIQHRFESCVDECGYEITTEQIPDNDPNQFPLFHHQGEAVMSAFESCPNNHVANGKEHPSGQHGVCTTPQCPYNEHNAVTGGTYDATTNTYTHPDGTVTTNYK